MGNDASTNTLSVNESFKSFGLSYLGNTTISGNVTIAGQTYLSDTDVVGSLTVDNSIAITGNAISVDGTLYLQNTALSSSLDLFNGAITIDKNGNIVTEGNIKVKGDIQIEGAITITATAGEDIDAHQALYVSSDKTVKVADSTINNKSVVIGIAANTTKKGGRVTIIVGGKAKGFERLKAGAKYYLGPQGTITNRIPANAVKVVTVGIGFSEDELLMQIALPTDLSESLSN